MMPEFCLTISQTIAAMAADLSFTQVTLTLICSALLLLASVLPWRLPFILLELVETSSGLTFQKFQTQAG